MDITQKIILSYIATNLAIVALGAGVLIYDITTSIRAWMKRREQNTGKEEQQA